MNIPQSKANGIGNAVNNNPSNKSQLQKQQQKFGSNLCAVLNDPRKDRTKIAYLFTKTWGSEFVDSIPVPAITTIHASPGASANKYKNIKFNEFKEHLDRFSAVRIILNQLIFFLNKPIYLIIREISSMLKIK